MNTLTLRAIASETADTGRIRLGGGVRLLPRPTAPAIVTDTGRIRNGGGVRLA